ncbi:MAG: hypothetical protein K6G88_10960 [Lachnospiraceae bacterium]|nr:hypothetical protein [Lachnospiraceae bacterium]
MSLMDIIFGLMEKAVNAYHHSVYVRTDVGGAYEVFFWFSLIAFECIGFTYLDGFKKRDEVWTVIICVLWWPALIIGFTYRKAVHAVHDALLKYVTKRKRRNVRKYRKVGSRSYAGE